MNRINFYLVNEPYGEFSNFAPYAIRLKDKTWPTVEHYYQAQKFAGQPDEEQIRHARSAKHAARMGRDRKRTMRNKWDCYRDEVMLGAVKAKFAQHPDLERLLLSTGKLQLVEHTRHDSYWGDGGNGSGRNMLGRYLMRVRREIRDNYRGQMLDNGRIEDIEAWVDYRPDDPQGLSALGETYLENGHLDDAEDCFRLLVRIRPDHGRYRLKLSEAAAARGKWRPAIYHALRAIKLDRDLDGAYACMGLALLNIRRYEDAVWMLRMALKKTESKGEYHTWIAQAYEALGNYGRADQHYRMAYHIEYPNDSGGFDEDIDNNDENWMLR